MKIEENVALKDYTTLRLGGQARYFAIPKTDDDIGEAVKFAKSKKIPVVVLGSGSNLVVADHLPEMLVLKLDNQTIEILSDSAEAVEVKVSAGYDWDKFVGWTVEQGLRGLEALSMIPGTVGATPVQNVGAYGQEVSNVIKSVRVYDLEAGSFRDIDSQECEFGYRDSVFKKGLKGKVIIESVTFGLSRSQPCVPEYQGVQAKIEELKLNEPLLVQIREAIKQIRTEKLPNPSVIPNVGSFFKNPFVTQAELDSLKTKYPDIVFFPSGNIVKLSAGWLIEQAGLKGVSKNGVGTYEKNALVLVNHSATSTKALLSLAQNVVDAVEKKFSIKLQIEPEILGYN